MSLARRHSPPPLVLKASACALALSLGFGCTHPVSSGANGDDGVPDSPVRHPTSPSGFGERPGEHRYLILHYSEDGIALVETRTIALPLPRSRVEPQGPWRVVVEGQDGEVLYETRFAPPTLIRGEFADEDGNLTPVAMLRDEATFAVRLPTSPEASRIRVYARANTLGGEDRRALRVGGETELEIGVLDASGVIK